MSIGHVLEIGTNTYAFAKRVAPGAFRLEQRARTRIGLHATAQARGDRQTHHHPRDTTYQ